MSKNQNAENGFPIVKLRYKKGDLIIKEGDYGLSIYKILKGSVAIFTEDNGKEVQLASLGPNSTIGEMLFLNENIERRSASARAMEDSLLEVWHPGLLKQEYEQMPPVIKYIADQTLKRLNGMNRLVVKLTDQQRKGAMVKKEEDSWISRRRYYRKKVNLPFTCSPLSSNVKMRLEGLIKDISLGGAGLEVKSLTTPVFPYGVGEEFLFKTMLPNEKNVEFECKLVSLKEGKAKETFIMGVSITEISEHSAKNLGFFLMP